MVTLEKDQIVRVTIHDWERGAETYRGVVRRMLARDRVEVELDPGANPDDPDERLTALVPIGDVAALGAQDDRRAA